MPVLMKRGLNGIPGVEEAKSLDPTNTFLGLSGSRGEWFPGTIQEAKNLKSFDPKKLNGDEFGDLAGQVMMNYVYGHNDIQLGDGIRGNIGFDGNHFFTLDATQSFKFYPQESHSRPEAFRHFMDLIPKDYLHLPVQEQQVLVRKLNESVSRLEKLDSTDVDKMYGPYFSGMKSFRKIKNLEPFDYSEELLGRLRSLRGELRSYLSRNGLPSSVTDILRNPAEVTHPAINTPQVNGVPGQIPHISENDPKSLLWFYYFQDFYKTRAAAEAQWAQELGVSPSQVLPELLKKASHEVAGAQSHAAAQSVSVYDRLANPIFRFQSRSNDFEFNIPPEQIAAAKGRVDRALLNETLFVIPNNDGEARRAAEILRAAGASHLQISGQEWGATLDKEPLDPQKLSHVKRVVVFEIPGAETEVKLKRQGLEVIPIDHHAYKGLDRRRPESSLEQLMALIHWPMSRTDEALAINDRGYIPGLKKMGLSEDQIRQIRKYDLIAQGRSEHDVDTAIRQAHDLIPSLPRRKGVYILDRVNADEAILKQELAIQSKDGLVSTFEIRPDKVGFSGNPAIVQALLKTKFEELGYEPGSFAQYGGGDPQASMFFGFKPTKPPKGESELIPRRVLEKIENMMSPKPTQIASMGTEIDAEVRAAGMLPRGSAIVTSSGNLSQQGIQHIIHAATGSMTRNGPKFDPTVKSVTDSVRNSLDLARNNGDHRVAIPFIGGKIFVERIGVSPQELADRIVESAIKNRGNLELRFVTFGDEDTQLFKHALAKYGASLTPAQAAVMPGSITDHSLHGASVIINAANLEVQFGGGLSGAIGRATGNSHKIDQEAQDAIRAFYSESH